MLSDESIAATDIAAPPRTPAAPLVLFQQPDPIVTSPLISRDRGDASPVSGTEVAEPDADGAEPRGARRRRRGGRGRRSGRPESENETGTETESNTETQTNTETETGTENDQPDHPSSTPDEVFDSENPDEDTQTESGTRRRRRRRRGTTGDNTTDDGAQGDPRPDDPPNTVVKVREPRQRERSRDDDEVTGLSGSTRLEAKKQRRREGRTQGRRRTSVITESEFLARRESVARIMTVRHVGDRIQIAVLEDEVLVEHYVSGDSGTSSSSLIGNVYLGRVQNVLPSMEAAFVDIGRGRNAVLYAGEVNWDAAGLEGQPKRIESALSSGDSVLVQVTKDPVGHKGARLTSQVSLAGRFLVYVPDGSMSGISRKLPDVERSRLKAILKKVVPDDAGVIVRTAAEGASEDELSRDVARLAAQWDDVSAKAAKTAAPALLYGEPDLMIRVVRDIFNEDFTAVYVAGDEAREILEAYISHVAPDLTSRVHSWTSDVDIFTEYRIDEQLAKALDRKVWLPSGGSLVIDRTEAMTVVDVNTGKFIGKGGNLEETVTRNNLEAAEEIARQLRLRDIGGMIVVDFIDMILESNRDLVLRRLQECLSRDRSKHQVAEVTSLGLVQLTRKKMGQGLLEAFSEPCEQCDGRGVKVTLPSVSPEPKRELKLSRDRGGRRSSRDRQTVSTADGSTAAPLIEAEPTLIGSDEVLDSEPL
jgi:ribonuclease E